MRIDDGVRGEARKMLRHYTRLIRKTNRKIVKLSANGEAVGANNLLTLQGDYQREVAQISALLNNLQNPDGR